MLTSDSATDDNKGDAFIEGEGEGRHHRRVNMPNVDPSFIPCDSITRSARTEAMNLLWR